MNKFHLAVLVIVSIAIVAEYGLAGFKIIGIILGATFVLCFGIWLLGFLVLSIMMKSMKAAWNEMKPTKVLEWWESIDG